MERLKSHQIQKDFNRFSIGASPHFRISTWKKIFLFKDSIHAGGNIEKPRVSIKSPKPLSYQEQHYAELLQWDPCFDLAAVLTRPLL